MIKRQGDHIYGYPQPSPRNGHTACIFENHMYVFGGREDNRILNDLWMFDLETLQWQELQENRDKVTGGFAEEFPVERSGHSCDLFGHFMVIFGGFYNLTKELNDLYLFNFHTQAWIKIFEEINDITSPLRLLSMPPQSDKKQIPLISPREFDPKNRNPY